MACLAMDLDGAFERTPRDEVYHLKGERGCEASGEASTHLEPHGAPVGASDNWVAESTRIAASVTKPARRFDGNLAKSPGGPSATVSRLLPYVELHYETSADSGALYRETVCELCEKTVSLALAVPLSAIRAKTRSTADIALARQIAMYLCHTTFRVMLTEVGAHFDRDRTTVSHACQLVENKRDDAEFDLIICQLESLLNDARSAMGLCHSLGMLGDGADGHRSCDEGRI